jgi:hypothetical protein
MADEQALIVAKQLPPDHTTLCEFIAGFALFWTFVTRVCWWAALLAYVIKLRAAFPVSTGSTEPGDRLVERITDLEKRLALAKADEAHAKLGKSTP